MYICIHAGRSRERDRMNAALVYTFIYLLAYSFTCNMLEDNADVAA